MRKPYSNNKHSGGWLGTPSEPTPLGSGVEPDSTLPQLSPRYLTETTIPQNATQQGNQAVRQPVRWINPYLKTEPVQPLNPQYLKPNHERSETGSSIPSEDVQSTSSDGESSSGSSSGSLILPEPLPPIKRPERWEKLYQEPINFYIAKLTPISCIPKSTLTWIRNASDERAAQEGMRFHEQSGQWVVDWVQEHCILYEGIKANTPLICDDWQYEYFMQLFGWMRFSDEVATMHPDRSPWIRRFSHAGIWIAKKNAKSPTLAATGLYMFVGDGEEGQKCYSVARDGKQAEIAHNHVIEMVYNSPKLSQEIRHKKTDNRLIHRRSKSQYTIVCGENYKSTEGYNGSLFVDETHVVDQQHVDRLKRAGISRIEPVHVEMSTAGNNADGYGYNRYQYGQRVSQMEQDDHYNPHFLFMDFSVDQTVTMDKLRDKEFVESIAPFCNPSMGRILRKEEFVADWQDSCQSETELRKFAMYRLNLWLKDSASWVELSDWLSCSKSPIADELTNYANDGTYHQYTLDDLKDYPCVAGLDMSKTQDMSALSLVFAVPDENMPCGFRPYTWTWHWLPECTANKISRFIDLKADKYKPFIHLLQSTTIDYELIATKLEWIKANYDLRCLGYDIFNAIPLLKCLINDYGWDADHEIIKVPQVMRIMAPACKDVERWIIRKEIHHPANELLNWQFQHVALEEDKHGNYRVIKPSVHDYRKVDGIVSIIIACAVLVSDDSICSRDSGSLLLYERKAPTQPGYTQTLGTVRHFADDHSAVRTGDETPRNYNPENIWET